MLSKKDLNEIKRVFQVDLNNDSESSDYKRGLQGAALIIHDTLRTKGKNDTAREFLEGIYY